MRYVALAADYDGTLAHDGRVPASAVASLERLAGTGRKLLLVTGRELPDLRRVFPPLELFDRVVAENGALLLDPATGETRALAPPPPPELHLPAAGLNLLVTGTSGSGKVDTRDGPSRAAHLAALPVLRHRSRRRLR